MAIRRVLEVSLHADPLTYGDSGSVGGQQIIIRELVKNIQHVGYGVDVLTAQGNPPGPERFSLGHLGQVVRLSPGIDRQGDAQWHRAVDAWAEAALAWVKTSGRRYDLIHSHYWISGLVARRLRARLGVPWVHTPVKMAEWNRRPGDPVDDRQQRLERELLHGPDAVTVSSLSEAGMIHGVNARVPVYVIPPGVDPTAFFSRDPGPVLRAYQLTRRPVIYVGRLELARGLREALAVLADRPLPEDFVLLVLGGTRREVDRGIPAAPPLAALSDRLHGHLRWLGGMPHRGVPPYLAASSVAIAPNQGPTLGIAVLESLASGVPVVGTRVPGVQDWIDEGRDGYLVDADRLDVLWDRALDLWSNPGEARHLGLVGQDKVHRLHTVTTMAEQMAACYREVTGLGGDQMGVGV